MAGVAAISLVISRNIVRSAVCLLFTLTGEVVHSSSVALRRTAQGTTYQGAYARVNVSGGITLPGDARLTLGVDNLADTRPDGAATDLGRRWFGGLSWGIGW